MVDRLHQEIMKPQHNLFNNEEFMKTFEKHSESKETIFGLEKEDFSPKEIVKIVDKNKPRYVSCF
jgi:microsomal dipeptidase-like Zn-dependent dipeptidase